MVSCGYSIPVSRRLPFTYVEHANVCVHDGCAVITTGAGVNPLKCAIYSVLLCGPGTTITHDAVKIINDNNCLIQWVGHNGLTMYSAAISSTSSMRNACMQIRKIAEHRMDLWNRMLHMRKEIGNYKNSAIPSELFLIESNAMRRLYSSIAAEAHVNWAGRVARLAKISPGDVANWAITLCNCALYSIATSVLLCRGYLPQIAVIHGNGSTPMSYDLADLVKSYTSIPFGMAYRNCDHDINDLYSKFEKYIDHMRIPEVMSNALDEIFK